MIFYPGCSMESDTKAHYAILTADYTDVFGIRWLAGTTVSVCVHRNNSIHPNVVIENVLVTALGKYIHSFSQSTENNEAPILTQLSRRVPLEII